MAITLLQKKKIQHILALAIGAMILVSAGVLWWGFFTDNSSVQEDILIIPSQRSVEIDMSILSHPLLEDIDEPREPVQIPPNIGRDNPLLPSP